MAILLILAVGSFVFIISTRPDEYFRELRLCKKHLPERHAKLMSMPFIQRYWHAAVLRSDKTCERTNNAPYYVFMGFLYLLIYVSLLTLAENVDLRVLSEDEDINYLFGGIVFYLAGVIWYPLFEFIGVKIGFEKKYPEKYYKNAALFFLVLYLVCILSFPGMLKLGIHYETAETLAAIPMLVAGPVYFLKTLMRNK